MSQPRIHSADQRQSVARGEIRKKPRLSRPHKGGMEYERVDALSDWIKMAAAAGFSQEKIAALVINQNTGKPISVETLQKYYGRELEIGLAEANIAMSHSAFAQGVGSPGVPNPNYGKLLTGTKLVDTRKWLVDPIAPVPAMTIWWEKTRSGRKEGTTVEHFGADGQRRFNKRLLSFCLRTAASGGQLPSSIFFRAGKSESGGRALFG